MKKTIIVILTLIMTASAFASETCSGNVSVVMDYPSKCEGHVAFKLSGTGNNWLCALSEKSDSMVLAAFLAGQTIKVRLQLPTIGNCESIEGYQKPLYMSITE